MLILDVRLPRASNMARANLPTIAGMVDITLAADIHQPPAGLSQRVAPPFDKTR
jgi:hypothetical protein